MQKPDFYALVVIEVNGQERLAGAFVKAELARSKGEQSGARFEVRPVRLS